MILNRWSSDFSLVLSCVLNIRTKRKPGTNPALTHKTHKGYLLLDPPIDLRQEITMAAPDSVSTVYGMANPIRFRPKIRQAPPISPTTKAKTRSPIMVPTKKTVDLPFVFSINLDIALMLFV